MKVLIGAVAIISVLVLSASTIMVPTVSVGAKKHSADDTTTLVLQSTSININ
jgi:hypothetical protein